MKCWRSLFSMPANCPPLVEEVGHAHQPRRVPEEAADVCVRISSFFEGGEVVGEFPGVVCEEEVVYAGVADGIFHVVGGDAQKDGGFDVVVKPLSIFSVHRLPPRSRRLSPACRR